MTAEVGSTGRVTAVHVVIRRSESTHDREMPHRMARRLELLDRELQLVDQFGIQQKIFRPDVGLILGQKIAQLEVCRDVRVGVLRRYLNESVRVAVGGSLWCSAALERPVAEVVKADAAFLFFGERNERDQTEILHLPRRLIE